jgi:hypothetical protein
MHNVCFKVQNQEFIRLVHSTPCVGDTIFLEEINGPLKVYSVTHIIKDGLGFSGDYIQIQLGA